MISKVFRNIRNRRITMTGNEDLDRFREEWLNEVRQQSQHKALSSSSAQSADVVEPPASPEASASSASRRHAVHSPDASRPSLPTASSRPAEFIQPKTHTALVCPRPHLRTMASMTQAANSKGNLYRGSGGRGYGCSRRCPSTLPEGF